MAHRSTEEQSRHDDAIQELAYLHDDEDWDVQADHISHYPDPPTLNGRVPDLYLEKTLSKAALEVETSRDDDQQQREDLQEWAEDETFANFDWYIVDEDGDIHKQ